MATETQRQVARRRAREVRSVHAERRREKEKRIEDLAVTVLVALDVGAECERQAGRALIAMIDEEGLSLQDAVEWCGSAVTVRTATRLRTLAAHDIGPGDGNGNGNGNGNGTVGADSDSSHPRRRSSTQASMESEVDLVSDARSSVGSDAGLTTAPGDGGVGR
jgi:hypothetical protein